MIAAVVIDIGKVAVVDVNPRYRHVVAQDDDVARFQAVRRESWRKAVGRVAVAPDLGPVFIGGRGPDIGGVTQVGFVAVFPVIPVNDGADCGTGRAIAVGDGNGNGGIERCVTRGVDIFIEIERILVGYRHVKFLDEILGNRRCRRQQQGSQHEHNRDRGVSIPCIPTGHRTTTLVSNAGRPVCFHPI